MRTILVVDDDPSTAKAVKGFIAEDGYVVKTTDNLRGVCFALLDQEEQVIAILANPQMPDPMGLEFLRGIVSSHPQLPVIVCVGECAHKDSEPAMQRRLFSMAEVIVTAGNSCLAGQITKPLDRRKLLAAIEAAERAASARP